MELLQFKLTAMDLGIYQEKLQSEAFVVDMIFKDKKEQVIFIQFYHI